MKLNGWQRLWIVVTVVYFVPIAGLTVLIWPTAERTSHRDEFITWMPAEARAHVDAASASEYDWNQANGTSVPSSAIPRYRVRDAAVVKSATRVWTPEIRDVPPPPGWKPGLVLLSSPVSFPNGAVLQIHVAKKGDSEPDARVARAYWAVVERAAHEARRTRVWQMALLWVVPCLTLYALGWSVAWVRRGFRGGATGRP